MNKSRQKNFAQSRQWLIILYMPYYKDPRTDRYYIEFQLLGKRYKRRMPPNMSEDEIASFERSWRESIVQGSAAPTFAYQYRGVRTQNGGDPGHLYILRCAGRYKIGRTVNIKNRITAIQNASPFDVELIATINAPRPGDLESFIHKQFENKRVKGEWFALTESDLHQILQLAG